MQSTINRHHIKNCDYAVNSIRSSVLPWQKVHLTWNSESLEVFLVSSEQWILHQTDSSVKKWQVLFKTHILSFHFLLKLTAVFVQAILPIPSQCSSSASYGDVPQQLQKKIFHITSPGAVICTYCWGTREPTLYGTLWEPSRVPIVGSLAMRSQQRRTGLFYCNGAGKRKSLVEDWRRWMVLGAQDTPASKQVWSAPY